MCEGRELEERLRPLARSLACRLFWIGVPVTAQRRSALIAAAAWAVWVLAFFMLRARGRARRTA